MIKYTSNFLSSFNSKVEEEKRNFIIALESIIEKHDIECQQ